jgi:hypothetical protein
MRDPITVDIETFTIEDADQYLDPPEPIEPPDLGAIEPAKNLVDPIKIAADIEKKRKAAMDDYHAKCLAMVQKRLQLLDRCALDPDLCRCVAIGWQFASESTPQVRVCRTTTDEKDALEYFWRDVTDHPLVSFNGLKFDFPILMRRSLYLGLRHPLLNLDRYRTHHIDLLDKLTHHGTIQGHALRFYLARFGYAVDDVHTGKDIAALVKAGDWEAVEAHCRADVLGTKWLAERMGLLQRVEAATGAF